MLRFLMLALLIGSFSGSVMSPAPSLALDCGVHPGEVPAIPDGLTTTRSQINLAVAAIQAYGKAVNLYLDCLDRNQEEQFFNMNKGQQQRWLDDYNKLTEGLAKAQQTLNQQIRIFNARQGSKDDNNESDRD